jgi:O-antigen ligase
VIRDNPMLGVGTGGFPAAYTALAARTGDPPTSNPHNEFLMIVAQFGILGLVLILALFGSQWWLAGRLEDPFDQAAARGYVLTMVVASMLSSTLVDHAEGMFFAYMGGLLFAGFRSSHRGLRAREGERVERGAAVETGATAASARPVLLKERWKKVP